jgi:hypothetical protein
MPPFDDNRPPSKRATTGLPQTGDWWVLGIIFGGFGLFFFFILFAGSCHSYSSASYGAYSGPRYAATPEPTADMTLLSKVRVGTKLKGMRFDKENHYSWDDPVYGEVIGIRSR